MNKKKMFARIVNNQKNVQFSDFVSIIEAFGFYSTRGEGSHQIFRNSRIPEFINLQNENGKAKPYQIKQFLSLVEKYSLRLEE